MPLVSMGHSMCQHISTVAAHDLLSPKIYLQCSYGKMFCELSIAAAALFIGLRGQQLSNTTCQNLGQLLLSEMSVGCFQAVVQIYMNADMFKSHDRLRRHMQISKRTE